VTSLTQDKRIRYAAAAGGFALVMAALYLMRLRSYLLFHSFVEIFTIVVAVGIFAIAWNSREHFDNNYLLFIGIAYLFVALIDLLHTLAYQGMNVFTGNTANLATQLWIVARYIQALSLLLAPFFLGKKLKVGAVFASYTAVTTLALLSIFYWNVFPECFITGVGLTRFKNLSEYLICFTLALSIALLVKKKDAFESDVVWLLIGSIVLTIASELFFTLYRHPYGLPNYLGHVLKLLSFYLVYRAVIVTGLKRPVDLLFRDLKHSEEELLNLNRELEGYARAASHDLGGPISSIKLAAEMLEEDAREPGFPQPGDVDEVIKYAVSIRKSSDKSFALIESMLSLARAGQTDEPVEEVDVSEVVREIIEERQLTGAEARIDLVNDLGKVTGSVTHIYQLFSNLIDNSTKHNRRKDLVISISLTIAKDGSSKYLVCDNGSGIPDDIIDYVFTPFLKGASGGSGIGLATVKRIVSAYGGEIKAYNENGACFEFVLNSLELNQE